MSSHQTSSDQVLSMVVEQAIYPITVEVMYSLFGPFGVEQLVVYPPTISEDGQPCVAADVRFCSAHAAAHALAYWDGRCIYFRCCRLQMWNATPDVLPAPTSPPTRTATPDAFMAGDTAASAHSTVLDPSVNIPTAASTSTLPHVQDTPPKSSLDSKGRVLVTSTTEYTLVAANPEVVTELAVLPGDLSSTTKAQEIPRVAHDAAPVCIAMVPVTCSTECSTQVDTIDSVDKVHDTTASIFPTPTVDIQHALDTTVHVAKGLGPSNGDDEFVRTIGTPPLASPTMLMSLLPAASPAPITDSAHRAINGDSIPRVPLDMEEVLLLTQAPCMVSVVTSMQLLVNRDLDDSLPTKCSHVCLSDTPMSSLSMMVSPRIRHETLVLRPMPWPSLLKDSTEG
ncbi:hypothetical protein CFC21_065469 [Triticum aestivum]|uniref:PTBP1-like RNA recognition motif 2 domain-containing protein n=2 Tax=Triticum aestivum TaxID=4565 RepID=A0A9R1H3C5_WHEAT|nr:cell surface sensor MSB2-like [Triticum aestivum]KAF7058401.1 hypothetical protein CFC21_065469 [Triticum aestivum]